MAELYNLQLKSFPIFWKSDSAHSQLVNRFGQEVVAIELLLKPTIVAENLLSALSVLEP